jgi:serine/threonine protein kinase
MAVEYCENGDLAQILDEHSLLDEDVAKFMVAELILGMRGMHNKGIIFRDLKPENILLDSDGHIRLADFGLAKQNEKAQGKKDFKADSFCGSPAYLAPEMLKKQGVSKSGDVYQVGVVLYEMMVGIPPFYNDNMKILYENIEKGKLTLPKYLSKEARKVVQRMLNKDPKKRPTLDDLMKDPFFEGIDWDKLEKKQLQPPVVLKKEAKESAKKDRKEDYQEMLFESESDEGKDEQRGGATNDKKVILSDEDYSHANRNF